MRGTQLIPLTDFLPLSVLNPLLPPKTGRAWMQGDAGVPWKGGSGGPICGCRGPAVLETWDH